MRGKELWEKKHDPGESGIVLLRWCQTDEHSSMGRSLAEAQKVSHTFPFVSSFLLYFVLLARVPVHTWPPLLYFTSSPHIDFQPFSPSRSFSS